MKVRYTGETYRVILEPGALYDVMRIEGGLYRIFSDTLDEDGLFPPSEFDVVDPRPEPDVFAANDPQVAIY